MKVNIENVRLVIVKLAVADGFAIQDSASKCFIVGNGRVVRFSHRSAAEMFADRVLEPFLDDGELPIPFKFSPAQQKLQHYVGRGIIQIIKPPHKTATSTKQRK